MFTVLEVEEDVGVPDNMAPPNREWKKQKMGLWREGYFGRFHLLAPRVRADKQQLDARQTKWHKGQNEVERDHTGVI
jgi:hypothetical protein